MTCALFDVDGTLIPNPSSERRFMAFLAERGVLGWRQRAAMLGFLLRYGWGLGRHAIRRNKAYLAGLAVDAIERLAREFVAERLVPALRPALLGRMVDHARRGEPVALLSGAPDFLVAPLARRLGAIAWRATVCAQEQGRFLFAPPRVHPFGPTKVDLARALCGELGVDLGASVAYADADDDLALLGAVAQPVLVSPEPRARAAACAHGWEILDV